MRRTIAALSLIFALTGCAKPRPQLPLHGTPMQGPAPELNLNDAAGHPYSLRSARGKLVVLFFGYTHCPDVCPTTLAHIAQAVHYLPPADIKRILGIFISVDPRRDTAAISQHYAQLFDHQFIGLGGTDAATRAVQQQYHVWSQALPAKAGSKDYTVAHNSAIFLIDSAGNFAELLPWDTDVTALTTDLKLLVEEE